MTAATSLSLGCIPVCWRALVNRLARRMVALDERLQIFLCYVCNSYPSLKLSQTQKWGMHLNLWLQWCPHQQPHPDVFTGDYDPCGQMCVEKWRIWRSKLLIVKTQQGLPCQMPPRELPVAVLSVKRSRCAHILTHNSAKVMAPSSYPSEKPKLTLTLTLCCKDKETPQRSNVTKEKK